MTNTFITKETDKIYIIESSLLESNIKLTSYIYKNGAGWQGSHLSLIDTSEHLSFIDLCNRINKNTIETKSLMRELFVLTDDFIIKNGMYGGKGVYAKAIRDIDNLILSKFITQKFKV